MGARWLLLLAISCKEATTVDALGGIAAKRELVLVGVAVTRSAGSPHVGGASRNLEKEEVRPN